MWLDMDWRNATREDKTMGIRIGINGFGPINRDILRASLGHDTLDIVAVNDITEAKTLAHLLRYDSVWGIFETDVQAKEGALVVNGKEVKKACRTRGKAMAQECHVEAMDLDGTGVNAWTMKRSEKKRSMPSMRNRMTLTERSP